VGLKKKGDVSHDHLNNDPDKFMRMYTQWKEEFDQGREELRTGTLHTEMNERNMTTQGPASPHGTRKNLVQGYTRISDPPPFLTRILSNIHESQERKARFLEEQQAHRSYDPVTGQKLFQPMICRGPKDKKVRRLLTPQPTPILYD
jgi:hypothetical protein